MAAVSLLGLELAKHHVYSLWVSRPIEQEPMRPDEVIE